MSLYHDWPSVKYHRAADTGHDTTGDRMPRASRREELLDAALSLFVERGYDGTSVAEIAGAVGVSKAAVSYHFPAKDDLLVALADPVLSTLEGLVTEVDATGARLVGEDRRRFLASYVDHLLAHGDVATWIDSDRGVLTHEAVGPRLESLHEATRRALGGGDGGTGDLAAASALGALWRPIRNLDRPLDDERDTLVAVAIGALDAAEA